MCLVNNHKHRKKILSTEPNILIGGDNLTAFWLSPPIHKDVAIVANGYLQVKTFMSCFDIFCFYPQYKGAGLYCRYPIGHSGLSEALAIIVEDSSLGP